MSQENVDVIRGLFEAWNARDMDAVRECYAPDAMLLGGLEDWPEPPPTLGRDAITHQ